MHPTIGFAQVTALCECVPSRSGHTPIWIVGLYNESDEASSWLDGFIWLDQSEVLNLARFVGASADEYARLDEWDDRYEKLNADLIEPLHRRPNGFRPCFFAPDGTLKRKMTMLEHHVCDAHAVDRHWIEQLLAIVGPSIRRPSLTPSPRARHADLLAPSTTAD